MANLRKDQIAYRLWITKVEEMSLLESIKILNREATSKENGWAMSNITEIIQDAHERGDLNK